VQGVQGGGVTLQQLENAIANASLDSTDDLIEGSTNKYFTTARVSYVHTQGVANTTWNITHNLNFHPNVTAQDSAGNIVEGEITFTNTVSLILSFSSPISGSAYLS
jgi:Flp pilus assembly protein TadG